MRADLIGTGSVYRREILRLDLIKARQELGLTRSALALAAEAEYNDVYNYETNPPKTWTQALGRIADALGIDLGEYGYVARAPDNKHTPRREPRYSAKKLTQQYPYHKFGWKMREARLARQMTQHELACAMGSHYTTLDAWEIGKWLPSRRMLEQWCRTLGEPIDKWLHSRIRHKQ